MTTRTEQNLRLPITAKQVLNDATRTLNVDMRARSWALPATSVPDEVSHYVARHSALGLTGPRPHVKKQQTSTQTTDIALKIDAAAKLRDLGAVADPLIKPILLYYSAAHMLGAYSRAYLDWEGRIEKHGIRCRRNSDLDRMPVEIEKDGFFPRLGTALFLLSGSATPFVQMVSYSAKPTAHTGQGELLEKFCAEEVGDPISVLTLNDLANFDYAAQLGVVRARHGFHKYRGLAGAAVQIDTLALFVASWLARYDTVGWKTVLDGVCVDYRSFFEDVFDRYVNFMFEAALDRLVDPQLPWDQARSTGGVNPYSPDDPRFGGNPDSV